MVLGGKSQPEAHPELVGMCSACSTHACCSGLNLLRADPGLGRGSRPRICCMAFTWPTRDTKPLRHLLVIAYHCTRAPRLLYTWQQIQLTVNVSAMPGTKVLLTGMAPALVWKLEDMLLGKNMSRRRAQQSASDERLETGASAYAGFKLAGHLCRCIAQDVQKPVGKLCAPYMLSQHF